MNINQLLVQALAGGASDMHVSMGVPPILRQNGRLVEMETPPLSSEDIMAIIRRLLNSDQLEWFEKNGEVDLSHSIPGHGVFRVNCYRQQGSAGIAFRMLNTTIPTMEELQLPEAVYGLTRRNRGLILVTGPTGSGKSTTLAAMTDLINREKQYHIITLEDPIEYYHKRKKSIITQREIGRDSMSFPGALRASLRQDPDVILVGEMRDLETISIAVTAAETGHLVLATLHTIDASQTVERIIDVFPSTQQRQIRAQLANCLAGIISQRLIRRKSNEGRIAAVEILVCTPAVRNLIREGKVHQIPSVIQTGTKFGMQTMDKHLQLLYEQEMISKEESLEYARDEESMLSYLAHSSRQVLR